jgi:hypothetical protein
MYHMLHSRDKAYCCHCCCYCSLRSLSRLCATQLLQGLLVMRAAPNSAVHRVLLLLLLLLLNTPVLLLPQASP